MNEPHARLRTLPNWIKYCLRSGENDRYSGIHDLGNGIRGGYDPDGAYVLHVRDSAGSNSF